MKKVLLRYIGKHSPATEFEINEKLAISLVNSGKCEYVKNDKNRNESFRDKSSNKKYKSYEKREAEEDITSSP